jgi:hypothetical protein
MIFTLEWAIQTGLTASIATIGSVTATRMTIWLFDGVKKRKGEKPVTECPLQGCLSCKLRQKVYNKYKVLPGQR